MAPKVIACRVMLDELRALMPPDTEFESLEISLHNRPRKLLHAALQAAVEAAPEALDQALAARQRSPESLIHHSDRGVQYACSDYVEGLEGRKIAISMSRPGNPYDNAKAERFIKTLKTEEVNGKACANIDDARRQIGAFIETTTIASACTRRLATNRRSSSRPNCGRSRQC